jgi:fido (protein-threonine AMPylation protein)
MKLPERDLLVLSLEDASRSYLAETLVRVPTALHDSLIAQVCSYRLGLADFCLAGYGGAGLLTTGFIRKLHQSLFPSGHKQEVKSFNGDRHLMSPGEYKTIHNAQESVLQPHQLNVFVAPDQVQVEMEKIVALLNAALMASHDEMQKTNAIFCFLIDFLAVHPFPDANGRVDCILADLLAIREGMNPFYFHSVKRDNKVALDRAIEVAQRTKDTKLAREVFEQHRVQ